MKIVVDDWLSVGALVLCIVGLVFTLATPIQAASEETPACEIAGKAEGQTLYSCIVEGTMCVWDPSPTLGAGVLDCDW